MKVIFLDIDGVLNSVAYVIATARESLIDKEFDQTALGLIKSVCELTGAVVVISSTWRKFHTHEELINIFKENGWVNFPLVSTTPDIHRNEYTKQIQEKYIGQQFPGRGYEIQNWIDRNNVTEYIIIDDDSDMLVSQFPHFVHVDNVNGFTAKDYCKAIRLLGHPDEQLEQQVNFRKTHS